MYTVKEGETVIWASQTVNTRTGWPIDEGIKLANVVLAAPQGENGWPEDTVILDLPPGMLIGGFFNAFLQHVYEQRPEALEAARKTKWHAPFKFQRDMIADLMVGFKPYEREAIP